jgi:hypothetical protein
MEAAPRLGRIPASSTNEAKMPSIDDILVGLTSIANGWRSVAIAWHLALAVSVLAVLAGWRPSARVAGYLLASPFLSVMAAAIVTGNTFNGTAFAALFLILVFVVSRLSREPVRFGSPGGVIAGALLVAFGWGYPHFLETDGWTAYAYAAPLGLLPCPTLSAVMGITLVFGQLGSRAWAFTLATAGLVYGAIGTFVLGVILDYGLLVGALLTTVAGVETRSASSSPELVPSSLARRPHCLVHPCRGTRRNRL